MDTYYDINKRFMAKPHAAFPFNFAFTTKLNLLTLCCFLSQIYFLQPCSTKQTTYIDIPQKKLIGYHYYPFYFYHYCYYNDDNCTCSLSLSKRDWLLDTDTTEVHRSWTSMSILLEQADFLLPFHFPFPSFIHPKRKRVFNVNFSTKPSQATTEFLFLLQTVIQRCTFYVWSGLLLPLYWCRWSGHF